MLACIWNFVENSKVCSINVCMIICWMQKKYAKVKCVYMYLMTTAKCVLSTTFRECADNSKVRTLIYFFLKTIISVSVDSHNSFTTVKYVVFETTAKLVRTWKLYKSRLVEFLDNSKIYHFRHNCKTSKNLKLYISRFA